MVAKSGFLDGELTAGRGDSGWKSWRSAFFAPFVRKAILAGIKKPPRNLLVSPGGAASTSLLTFLNTLDDWNSPEDSDGLKHLSYWNPRARWAGNVEKIILLTGEAGNIVESLHRRRYCRQQLLKLSVNGKEWRTAIACSHSSVHHFLRTAIARQEASFENRLKTGPNFLRVSRAEIESSSFERLAEFIGVSTGELSDFMSRPGNRLESSEPESQ